MIRHSDGDDRAFDTMAEYHDQLSTWAEVELEHYTPEARALLVAEVRGLPCDQSMSISELLEGATLDELRELVGK